MSAAADPTVLEARGLRRAYRHRGREVEALDGVDLRLERGGLTALVGPSGSGKSTLARCLALLERPDAGEVRLDDVVVSGLRGHELARARRRIQLVPQDPARAVQARWSAAEVLEEPLRIAGLRRAERRRRGAALLERVGLDAGVLARPASSLSGGQVQRLVLARALLCEPRVLILDEAFSGLDLSLKARLVDLVIDLALGLDLACLLLSHDRALVDHLADRILTLEAGRIVAGASRAYFDQETPTPTERPGAAEDRSSAEEM